MSEEEQGFGHGQPIADEGTLALAVPKASDILEKAAEIVGAGWTQGSFSSKERSCFCVRGALSVAARARNLTLGHPPSEMLLCEVILGTRPKNYPAAGSSLVTWNDAPDRTQAEVVAKLREAAALAQDQGQ